MSLTKVIFFVYVQKFLCCGRLIFGPDVRSLYMTLVLILVPMASFCVFVGRHLMTGFSDHSGIAIMVFAVIHTCAVSTLFSSYELKFDENHLVG